MSKNITFKDFTTKNNITGEVTCVGIDAHKNEHAVSMLIPWEDEPIEWKVANVPKEIRKMVRRIGSLSGDAALICYEAGPCGFALQRQIEAEGMSCMVVAPSLIPVRPGDRVKTDRRDARKLAEMLRAGLLTGVALPTEDEEAVRDMCRCRGNFKRDLTRSRHRLSMFLLRRGIIFREGSNWTDRHRRWLKGLKFDRRAERVVFDEYLQAVEHLEERVGALDLELETVSKEDPYREAVGMLRCFRGIDTVSAMIIATELHCFQRFNEPGQLMSYLGLVPGENSSGQRIQRGPITKAGNTHVRRILIEAAWHYRRRPAVGPKLKMRRKDQPKQAIEIADRAMRRLYRRFWRLANNGKPMNKAVTAAARELAGFIWDVLFETDPVAETG